jgi:hypothetical protein
MKFLNILYNKNKWKYKLTLCVFLLILITYFVYNYYNYLKDNITITTHNNTNTYINDIRDNNIEANTNPYIKENEFRKCVIYGLCTKNQISKNGVLNDFNISSNEPNYPTTQQYELYKTKNVSLYETENNQYEAFTTHADQIIEGLNIGREIRRALEAPFRPVIDFVNRVTDNLNSIPGRVNTFINAFNELNSAISNEVDTIGTILNEEILNVFSFFDVIIDYGKLLESKLALIRKSFDELGDAINLQLKNIGKIIKTEMDDVTDFIKGGGICAGHFITNFRSCSLYYILDFIFQIFKSLFITFPIWLFQFITGIDLSSIMSNIEYIIDEMDKIVKNTIGFSIFHFPKSIINKCYKCNEVNFGDMVTKIKHDNNVLFPQLIREANSKFIQAGNDFKNVFIQDPETDQAFNNWLNKLKTDNLDRFPDLINSANQRFVKVGNDFKSVFT